MTKPRCETCRFYEPLVLEPIVTDSGVILPQNFGECLGSLPEGTATFFDVREEDERAPLREPCRVPSGSRCPLHQDYAQMDMMSMAEAVVASTPAPRTRQHKELLAALKETLEALRRLRDG